MRSALSNEPHRVDASHSYTLRREQIELLKRCVLWNTMDKAQKLSKYERHGPLPETFRIIILSGVRLSLLGTAATVCPILPASDGS
jgi:hypothetical protein